MSAKTEVQDSTVVKYESDYDHRIGKMQKNVLVTLLNGELSSEDILFEKMESKILEDLLSLADVREYKPVIHTLVTERDLIDGEDTSRLFSNRTRYRNISLTDDGKKVAKEIAKEMILDGELDADVVDVEFDDDEFHTKLFAQQI